MINIKNLLPLDTRATEILSSFSLILSSLLIFYAGPSVITESMRNEHHWMFWDILLFLFGCFQITAVIKNWDAMVRAILSLVIGIYWIWLGVANLCQESLSIVFIVSIVLGAMCQYSYIVNLLYAAKKSWT